MEKQTTKPTHRKHHPLHDYRERCVYHVTLVCSERDMVLGKIVGENIEHARCELTPLGAKVSECINAIGYYGKKKGRKLRILAKSVMPEHCHFILFVEEKMDCTVGEVIHGFKIGCNKALRMEIERQKRDEDACRNTAPESNSEQGKDKLAASNCTILSSSQSGPEGLDSPKSGGYLQPSIPIKSKRMLESHALFEPDYDETRLRRKGQLSTMINYVHNNPQHRWLKQHHKDLLMPVRGIMIAGKSYDAIGNVNLLGLPRHQVWVRSRWSDEEKRNYKNNCVLKARHGYALISPFISPHEAAVRDVCLKEGHSIIQLVDNGFSKYTQCPGGLYDYCVNGQVLILVPSDYPHVERKKGISRQECVVLNERASEICEEK